MAHSWYTALELLRRNFFATSDSSEPSSASILSFWSSHWISYNLHWNWRLSAFLLVSESGNKESDLLEHFLLPPVPLSPSLCCCCGMLSSLLFIGKKNQRRTESVVTGKTRKIDKKDRKRNQNKDSPPRSATAEFWKIALTIAKEKSNHWAVFLLSFWIAPLLH